MTWEWSEHALIGFLIGVIAVATYLAVRTGRVAWRAHLLNEARESAIGNTKLRKRLYRLVIKDMRTIETVHPADSMRGWVWIVVAWRKPFPGERPEQAHTEQIGWAMTRCGARRQLKRMRARNERGASLLDLAMLVGGLMLAAFVVSKVTTDFTAGEILDWLIQGGKRLLGSVFG